MGIGIYERWPVEKVIVRENVRKHFGDESLRQHAESLKKDGQLRPLLVLRDGTLVAGERTLRAAKLTGLTHVDVKVLEADLSSSEIKKLQLVENLMREGLSDAEVYLACKELTNLNPDWRKKDLAAALHFSDSMCTRICAVDDLVPEAKEAFLAGKFGFSKAYAIAKGPKEDQLPKLAAILCGASRDEVERQRRVSGGSNSAVKLSRVKIVLPNGDTVVVSGRGLNMARLDDVLMRANKEVRKAASEHDIKSFSSMQRVRRERGGGNMNQKELSHTPCKSTATGCTIANPHPTSERN
jgi:ParB/RepB/Spo0J family partition protein